VQLGDFGNPSFLGRRQQHMNASARTELRFDPQAGTEAGIAAFQGDEYFYTFGLTQERGRPVLKVSRRAGADDPAGGRTVSTTPVRLDGGAPLRLRIDVRAGRADFYYATAGDWTLALSDADASILSTKTAGGFVGTTFGPYAVQRGR
jgi:xylan 1,4-beta-xylosidase